MHKVKKEKVISFPVNPGYLKDLVEGKVFRFEFAKDRVLELLKTRTEFEGQGDFELEPVAEKVTRCLAAKAAQVRSRPLDVVANEEKDREINFIALDIKPEGEELWDYIANRMASSSHVRIEEVGGTTTLSLIEVL